MIITKKFEYNPMSRTDSASGVRHYLTETGTRLPSVTTILSETADKSFLDQWKERVGEEEAGRIVKEASFLGSGMHDNLEEYVLYNTPIKGNYMTQMLTKLIIKNGLSKVDEVWGAEVALHNNDLYAGTCDLVGVHNGTPAIMDYKNSLKPKKKEWITDYFLQISAYGLAHDWLYGTNIKKGVIMMAVRTGVYIEFIIEGDEFIEYQYKWCKRVQEYYNRTNIDK